MGNPDASAAAQSSASDKHAATEPTFEDKVNEVAKQMTKGNDGNWGLPDDIKADENVLYAAKIEKRRRDTESALSKTRLNLKTEEELRQKLETRAVANIDLDLSPEDAEELETLRDNDPEAWRKEMNKRERKATATFQEELATARTSVSQEAELERRETVLDQFNEDHSDVKITDELLESDIPPRITKKLTEGKITFEEFLTEAYDFMVRPVKVAGTAAKNTPNMGKVGGGSSPSAEADSLADKKDYSKTTF